MADVPSGPKPSLCRDVIYMRGTERCAAKITAVYEKGDDLRRAGSGNPVEAGHEVCGLIVFRNSCGPVPVDFVPHDEDGSPHTWHWPPRV